MQPVLHNADELLVAQLVVVVHVKDLEDGVDQVTCQLQARGHVHSPPKLILANGATGKVVHLHGDGKVLQVVEELEEGAELVEGDAL